MIKIVITCLLLSKFTILIDAQIYADGTVLKSLAVFTCNQTGPQCADDCNTLLLCAASSGTPFATVPCATASPSTPYCVGNTCAASPGNCSSPSSFRCTNEGTFPDPTDCTRYRHCDGSNAKSEVLVCPPGFIFNSKVNRCEMGQSSSRLCNKVDCSQKTNEIVVYKLNPAYFSFCFVGENGVKETIMFKCDFEHSEVYDLSINKCTFNCKGLGYYQDPSDCNSYYICSLKFGGYKADKFQCPSNYFFDGLRCSKNSSNCIEGSLPAPTTSTTTTTTTTPTTMEPI